jgi:NAD(P)-dependent dehydrogenase (short-subunit alcohol dehydrogenase family)
MNDFSNGSLDGRVVVITGAGQGIGRATAKAMAAAGALPVIAEIDDDKGQSVAREIGNRAMAVRTDVADPASLDAMVKTVLDAHGKVDVLINNAAIFSTLDMRPFWEIPLEEWDAVLRVNITGCFLAARAVVETMRAAKFGRIINFSSAAVTMGRPNYTHYTTSKAALIGMTRSMARELGPDGVTVNAVMPGATFTEIERATVTPEQKEAIVRGQSIPRPETPEDLLGTLMFLSSDASAFMTGQCLTVDGGLSYD